MGNIDPKLMAKISTITAHRARVVLDHILKHGFVTTEQLREVYGYHHPPRARMDVLDMGIPLETYRVKDSRGRSIGAYRFGDPSKIDTAKLGRMAFSKAFKNDLYVKQKGRCAITGQPLERRQLSLDHRIPYQVTGDQHESECAGVAFMLISVWLQRIKSWSCEHCRNWRELRDKRICSKCFWASPEKYEHIAMEQRRRVDLEWIGEEVKEFKTIAQRAAKECFSIADWIKRIAHERASQKESNAQ